MKSVLVTGGSGFIGRALVAELMTKSYDVKVYDRVNGDDIMDMERLRPRVEAVDICVHLSGVLGTDELFDAVHQAIDVNIHGTVNVLDACVTGATAYVGITMPPVFASVYTATKVAATRLASAYHLAYGLPVSHVRAYNAFGPGQAHGPGHPRKIIPTFAVEAWAGRPIPIWGDGEQGVDLVSTCTLASILAAAVEVGDDTVIDGGSGTCFTVNEVADMVIRHTGSRAGVKYLPMRRGEIPTNICAEGEGWELLAEEPTFDIDELTAAIDSYKP